jgi:glycosyltransferase involved in cell wall biosynthesis
VSGRLLVVSHPCVIPVNQAIYVSLLERGWDVHLVVPTRWRHEYSPEPFVSSAATEMEGRLTRIPVALAGRPARHVYLARPSSILRRFKPDVAFVEEECYSVPAGQWAPALRKSGVSFGIQADENLDRRFPALARWIRARVLHRAAFVAARSPEAGELVRRWGATGEIGLVPHALPSLTPAPRAMNDTFTVGFVGRLVEEKGVRDLVAAASLVAGPVNLLFVGDGPLREELRAARLRQGRVEVLTGIGHDRIASVYARMDVLALPSRTTPRWAEQFGRVLAEALACGVPVIGSDSGAIPWVIGETGGGLVVPEGRPDALADAISSLRDSERRRALSEHGREAVLRVFSAETAAKALERLLELAPSWNSATRG